MTYMIDTSASMDRSKHYWFPIGKQLVDKFIDAGVNMGDYTLINYLTTVSVMVYILYTAMDFALRFSLLDYPHNH